ncbi:MAG: ABC transporter substrate binding protein [Candidatus Calescibacterium sp.]|jgi:ABC-type uncharacterized transport system substrate-binding protein|nr:ABC transporter substrate binding protein [Candidatus Calescibacterium sp.]
MAAKNIGYKKRKGIYRRILIPLFFSCFSFLFLFPISGFSSKILVLKQEDDSLYNKVADGIKSSIEKEENIEVIIDNCQSNVDLCKDKIEKMRIKSKGFAVISLGIIPTYAAFEMLGGKKQNPVLFSLVFSPEKLGNLPENFAYFNMMPDPKMILSEFQKRFQVKEIVIPFSRDSAGTVLTIKRSSEELDIILRDILVSNDSDVRKALGLGKPFWLIPDATVVNSDTINDIYSAASQVPAIGFSEAFAKMGVALSYQIDFEELGKELGKTIVDILKGKIDIRKKKVFFPPVKFIEKQ